MKKSDLILAQKTLAARQVKLESQVIKEELKALKATYSVPKRATSSQQQYRDNYSLPNSTRLESPASNSGYESFSSSMNKSSSLPEIKAASSPKFNPPNTFEKDQSLSKANESLVEELSKRTITEQAILRKKQIQVSKSLQKASSTSSLPPSSSSSPHLRNSANSKMDLFSNDRPPSNNYGNGNGRRPATSSSAVALDRTKAPTSSSLGTPSELAQTGTFTITEEEVSQNYFMPKRKILRPDGASLLDIYQSKKDDTWGKIIKAQYLEDELRKVERRKEKDRSNEEYATLLKKQLDEIRRQKEFSVNENNVFAQLENATAKRTEDLQKQRTEDAIRRHKQFISNALEDIGIKHRQREEDLKEELTASTLMVNHARRMIAEEEEKRRQEKEYQRQYQETVYQENLANIARKEKAKFDNFAEDKRIIAEREAQIERERQQREAELLFRMQRSTEGPAHHIVQKIVTIKKQHDDQFYQGLARGENSLNRQLKASEDAAKRRAEQNGQDLTDEWVRNTEIKAKKKVEDEERNNRIISTMHQMIRDQEEEDRRAREQQRAAQRRYQEELDAQVRALRQRSIDSLQKTMSEQEMKYNSDLIQKTSVYLR